jgi:predicted amidohydrolase YtcJ
MRRLSVLLTATCLAWAVPAVARPAADLIVRHARIWTGAAAHPEGAAVAVLRDRIVAVGAERDVAAWRGPATHVVDAGGRRLLPGFNDAHVHLLDGGGMLATVDLSDAATTAEFVRRVGHLAARYAPGEWVQSWGWDETKWDPARLPTRQDIDPVTPANPALFYRYDGHMLVANSRALALAGITRDTKDPPGGVIVHDADGEPTGALKDAAADLLARVVPEPGPEQRRRIAKLALAEAASHGVTSLQAMSIEYSLIATLRELADAGELTARIYAAVPISNVEDQARLGTGRAFGGPLLRIGALKSLADGSLGSSTAYFYEPFLHQPGNRGLLSDDMLPIGKMRDRMLRADGAGLQLCIHAIGDAAIASVLDLYGDVERAHGRVDRRWRIEHAQHLAAADFDRFAKLGVIASVQPYHAIDDGRWLEERIGHDRASRTYAFRSFLDHGVRIALGTDWPVAPLDPMLTLYAATTRATLDGRHPDGWFPEQKLTIREALAAYTMGSAYAEFAEHDKGSIETGKYADMVLVDADVLAIAPARIRDVKVLKTWVGGRLVWDSAQR